MKMIHSILIAGILSLGLAGLSFAAVEVKSAGTVIGKTETVNITGPAIASSGTDITISTLTETGNKTITGDLTVTRDIVDTSIYTNAAGSYPQRLATIGADGTIYGTRSVLVDSSLYTASAGTGGVKHLVISADGTIYGTSLY